MTGDALRGYRPIGDYALIGDAHSAALVARDGSIDWCCWPHFDSPAVFCRLLDARDGGSFRVGPAGRYSVSRSYLDATNVLATTFTASGGEVRVTDLMPVERRSAARRGEDIASRGRILRLVEGLSGAVELEVFFRPTFDYARARTDLARCSGGAVARAGRESLALACPLRLEAAGSGGLAARTTVSAGERFWVALTYGTGGEPAEIGAPGAEGELAETVAYWRAWSAACTYRGPYHDLVRRSALTLKLLTFEPTGAVVAAPTTSLPEEVGGSRNWDYRYTWLRDSALILYALQAIGYHDEATDFWGWLESLCVGCRGDLRIMYTLAGGTDLDEQTLEHLEGYRGSRPVRIGNAASGQTQLDVYGEVLDAAHFCFERMPRPVAPELGRALVYLADQAAARWREPDYGIWEVRGGPRQFLYSKLLCWVALDRAVRLAERRELQGGDVGGWQGTREAIRQAILTEGYNEDLGAFTQVLGEPALDASVLAIPLVGFLPATDHRVRSTAERIRERLTSRGLDSRYRRADGLRGGEATFALCSFWLVDNLALGGRVAEARALFERVVGNANDVGLLAEEVDPLSGELLGNFPQGFTHLALIRSALHIAKAEVFGAENSQETPADRQDQLKGNGRMASGPSARDEAGR